MPAPSQSARDVVDIANAYAQGTVGLAAALRRTIPEALYQKVRSGVRVRDGFTTAEAGALAAQIGNAQVHQLVVTIHTAEAVRDWQRSRVVYRVHPALCESLLATDSSAPIPCEIFRQLPHPNPFVVFPEPIAITVANPAVPLARQPEIVGMLVTGYDAAGLLCGTDSDSLARLNIALASRLQYVGQDVTYEEQQVQISVSGTRTVAEMAERQRSLSIIPMDPSENLNGFNLAVGLLLYLCSDDRDARPANDRRTPRKKRRGDGRSAHVVDVGFDVGPRLFATPKGRNDANSPEGKVTDSSARRAHLRRAHWHTYWTGPRTEPVAKLKWLHPVLVNAGVDDPGRAQVVDASRG